MMSKFQVYAVFLLQITAVMGRVTLILHRTRHKVPQVTNIAGRVATCNVNKHAMACHVWLADVFILVIDTAAIVCHVISYIPICQYMSYMHLSLVTYPPVNICHICTRH